MQPNRLLGKDAVSVFLREHLYHVAPSYFGKSEVQIGHAVSDGDLQMVYRLEQNGVLLICSVKSIAAAVDAGGVRRLVRLLRRIEAGVPAVREIHGLVIEDVLSPTLRAERMQLRRIYEACGARQVIIDGQNWMVYRTGQGSRNTTSLH